MSKTVNEALIYLFQKMNGKKPEGKTIAELIMSGADDYQGGGGGDKVTLIYALGEYGTGDVPDPVTVDAGTEVNIEFENDIPTREGYSFIGWATTDGAESAEYTEDGTNTITMTEDVTLYPVFVEQYTLTYELGNDATGSVPSPKTVDAGEYVNIDFTPYPSCVSDPTKEFIGWAYTDGAESANFPKEQGASLHMDDNVTLYPVFAAVESNSITLDNTDGGMKVSIPEAGITVNAGQTDQLNYFAGNSYSISFAGAAAKFTGVYGGVEYTNQSLSVYNGVADPQNNSSWTFSSGDHGTITFYEVSPK